MVSDPVPAVPEPYEKKLKAIERGSNLIKTDLHG
jgi:hypothetical protein